MQAQILCAPGQLLHMNVLIIKLLPRLICFSVRLPPNTPQRAWIYHQGTADPRHTQQSKQVIMMYTQF
jgi:hypothetical protein